MSVSKCKECGYEITAEPDRCPNCGEKFGIDIGGAGKIIKRILLFLLAVYVLFSALKYF